MSIRVMSAMLSSVNLNRNHNEEKQRILLDLHSAVKECQMKYGGRTELATESDHRIVQICNCFEAALCHGLRQTQSSALRQVADLVSGTEPPSFWHFIQSQLTPHERERFASLRQVWTDRGRSRSLIRAALNERSLERYIHCWLAHPSLNHCYEEWSLMRDTECNSMLPSMAAGLVSILFAISIDLSELNVNRGSSDRILKSEPIIAVRQPQTTVSKKSIKRQVISFDEDSNTSSPSSIVASFPKFRENITVQSVSMPQYSNQLPDVTASTSLTEQPALTRKDSVYAVHNHSTDSNEASPLSDCFELNNEVLDICLPLSDSGVCDNQSHARTESVGSDLSSLQGSVESGESCLSHSDFMTLKLKLAEKEDRCNWLESRIAELSLENQRLRDAARIGPLPVGPYFSIDIPNAHKIGSHYEYEVTIIACQGNESWSLLRRYKDFYKLHKEVCKKYAGVSALDFPPKKTIGNMDSVFVEERRQRLQAYLRHLVVMLPQLSTCYTRTQLECTLPFFNMNGLW